MKKSLLIIVLVLLCAFLLSCDTSFNKIHMKDIKAVKIISPNFTICEFGLTFNKNNTEKISNNENIYFTNNEFYLCISFHKEYEKDVLKSNIILSPNLNFNIIKQDAFTWHL